MMRACVVAFAVTAFVQPALARDHSRKHPHQVTRHHHGVHGHVARTRHRAVVRVAPIESGYAMPKTFEEADAMARGRPAPRPALVAAAAPTIAPTPAIAAAPAIAASPAPRNGALDAMIARHAAANGLPAELVRRVAL